MKAVNKGFTLIELMIVVAIVAILAAIALPAYQKYTARAKFSEVVAATNGVKQQVELCIFDKGASAISACVSGANGPGYNIQSAANYKTKYIATIAVANGVITATAEASDGLDGATFILTPDTDGAAGQIDWTTSGTCTSKDLC
nr:prepilin-type N-terminal cleavage/methylation domain-containing protein [Plesiomonas shigelloides]